MISTSDITAEAERRAKRAETLRAQAVKVCERRTAELVQARALADRLTDDAALGRAVQALIDQIVRLRRTPCSTQGFGFSPAEIADAARSEIDEVEREPVGSTRAQHETLGVVATALHLTLAHGTPLLAGLHAEAEKLRGRLDRIDAGGTWTDAKADESERPLGGGA